MICVLVGCIESCHICPNPLSLAQGGKPLLKKGILTFHNEPIKGDY